VDRWIGRPIHQSIDLPWVRASREGSAAVVSFTGDPERTRALVLALVLVLVLVLVGP